MRCGDTLTCQQKSSTTVGKSRQTVQSFPDQAAGLSTRKRNSPELCRPGCHSRNRLFVHAKCHRIAPSHASFVPSPNLPTFAPDDGVLHGNTWRRGTQGVNSCENDRPGCQDCLMKISATSLTKKYRENGPKLPVLAWAPLQPAPPKELRHHQECTTGGSSCWSFCRRLSCTRYKVKVNPTVLHTRDRHGVF